MAPHDHEIRDTFVLTFSLIMRSFLLRLTAWFRSRPWWHSRPFSPTMMNGSPSNSTSQPDLGLSKYTFFFCGKLFQSVMDLKKKYFVQCNRFMNGLGFLGRAKETIACESIRFSFALRRWGRFARRNVCDSATKIPY